VTIPRRLPLLLGLTAFILAFDRVTKMWISAHLPEGRFIPVIPHFLRISHWQNEGAAFSFLADTAAPNTVRWGLIAFTCIASIVILAFLWRLSQRLSATTIALALILGGAVGNLYDRILYASVTDFIEVTIVHYHWPDFNVADSAICVGAALLLLDAFFAKPDSKSTEST
jgi:signal peptidase II